MKKLAAACLLVTFCIAARAQQKTIDSLLAKVDQTGDMKKITPVLDRLQAIPHGYDALFAKEKQDLARAEAQGNALKQERALLLICYVDFSKYDTPGLLNTSLSGIRISRQSNDGFFLTRFLHQAALAYLFAQDFHKSVNYSLQAASVASRWKDTTQLLVNLSNLESDYKEFNNPDSALYYAKEELRILAQHKGPQGWESEREAFSDMGEALTVAGKPDSALKYYRLGYVIQQTHPGKDDGPYLLNNIAKTFLSISKPDSARKYALESYAQASKNKIWDFTADAAGLLTMIYDGKDDKKALFYLKAQMTAKDSINGNEKSRRFQMVADKQREEEQELADAQERYNARVRLVMVVGAATIFLVIGFILWRNNRQKQKANHLLSEQKEEIEAQRDNLEKAFGELKTTQTQLIQSEKMASLGELTAGIAHEIQNPLNFVNNFSDVSRELMEELNEELDKGDTKEAKAISMDVIENLGKITHHGKRADAIVKGMLQHSQSGSGAKEPTNINVLADEYLRLSYHGLRSKDKSFNAELITNFDEKLPKVNVIPQDIGRVMLNLFNNAFYAVNQKSKTAGGDYKPEVSVSTLSENGQVTIKVKDNGIGIPDAIKEKIMQPFFTTKPTGEGTGLGLSLTYDMVVKGHGGNIQVNSKEGEGSEFVIMLPA